MNAWHDVQVAQGAPEFINAVIEVPRNTRAKYELDQKSGLLRLTRVMFSSMFYPANYGFIPRTWCKGKSPLGVLVLSQIDVVPLCIVEARVIGSVRTHEGTEATDTVIAVATCDQSVVQYRDVVQLPEHVQAELRTFLEDHRKSENKVLVVDEFQRKDIAQRIVTQALDDYRGRFV